MAAQTPESQNRERKFYTNPRNFYVLIVILYFCWAICVPLTKVGYEGFGIGTADIFHMMTFAGVRLFAAGFLALLFCICKGVSVIPGSKKELWQIIKLSLLMSVVQYIILYIGTANSQGAAASILCSSGAFLGILFSSLVFKEDKLTIRKLTGCVLGMIAVVILNIQDVRTGMVFSAFGSVMIIASQAAGTLGAVYLKYISQGRNAIYVGGLQSFLGGGMLIVMGLLGGGMLRPESGDPVKAVSATISMIAASAIALVISNQLYKYVDISKVVIFTILSPVFGTLASAVLLKESLASAPLLVSLIINCIGVSLVTMERKK